MSDIVDEEKVRRIAKLARLALNEEEVRTFTPQLSEVLTYVQRLDSIIQHSSDSAPSGINRLADDVPGEMMNSDALIRIAPATDGPFVRVPKVIDDGGSS